MTRQSGVTLLEAIIALALMATGAIVLFAWMSTNAQAVDRAAAQSSRLVVERSALAVIETINPMAEPRGQREFPGLRVAWQAREVAPVQPGRGPGGPSTVFDVALYELEVTASDGQRTSTRFTVRRMGWVTARSFEGAE